MTDSASAFVFPGQGSQFVGMLSGLTDNYSVITEVFAAVSEQVGYDVWLLSQEGPTALLNQTQYTQVVMLAADVAIFQLLTMLGVTAPKIMAGHSLGEYAALVCAGALDLGDAAKLVARRGQLMQEFSPLDYGAMAAIVGLTDQQVMMLCQDASDDEYQVYPANYNAIGQVVIAGHKIAVEKALKYAESAGARLGKMIPVSVPCHCPLLQEAATVFAKDLAAAQFKAPEIAVIANVDLSIYQSAEQIRAILTEQLYKPVRWVETIQLMKKHGIKRAIECGPGRVLGSLIKRIESSLTILSVDDILDPKRGQ